MAPPNNPTPAEAAATQAQADAMSNLARALEAASKNQQSYNQSATTAADAMSEISEAAQKQVDGITSASESMKSLSDSLKNSSKLTKVTIKDLGQLAKEYAKNSKAIQTAVVAFKTFAATLKAFKAIGGGIVSTIGSIAGAIFELGAAIISAPFKMIEWLIGRAKKGMGGTELAQEYENVREVFGDIAKGTSKDVINIGRSLATGVIAPGLMARQVFGTLAEAIKEIREVAEAAPAAFQMLSSQFNRSGLQIMAMAKGLGIGKEELVGLESRAIATGEEIITTFAEMTKYSKNLGAQFGLNSKAMSRDMGRAMKDVKHFANATVKEIAEATVYAHKLGFELKDITGVLDAFNTFDQAAENVAKLSQAFGVNIDTMKLLEANTPADALNEIKNAFTAANKSADQMNRHELQLLAQTVGLTEEQVKQGLSMKNVGASMDAVKSSSAALQTQTLDTGKAISMLANDIKKLVKEGETPEGGTFFEIFIEGFVLGIDRSKEFQSLLQAVRKDMYIVRDAGKAVGAAFVQFFPGFKEFLDGVKTFLDPGRIKSLMSQVVKTFTDFFKSLSNGTATFEGLLDSLQKNFFNFFSNDKGGQKILSGLSKMWKAVERIISTGIDWLTGKIKIGVQFLIDLLNGTYTSDLSAAGSKLQNNVLGGLNAAKESPIVKSLINAYQKLEKPLGTLFEKVLNLAIDKLGKILSKYKWEIALVTLGPTVASTFAQAIAGPIVKAAFAKMVEGVAPNLANILRGGLTTVAQGAATEAATKSATKAATKAATEAATEAAVVTAEKPRRPTTPALERFRAARAANAAKAAATMGTSAATEAAAAAVPTAAAGAAAPASFLGVTGAGAAGAGAAATVGLYAAGAAGIALIGMSAMKFKETRDYVSDQVSRLAESKEFDEISKSVSDVSRSLEDRRDILDTEMAKLKQTIREEEGLGIEEFVFGEASFKKADAQARLDRLDQQLRDLEKEKEKKDRAFIKNTKEYNERIKKEQAEEVEKFNKKLLDEMGVGENFTVLNAKAQVEKLRELSKEFQGMNLEAELHKIKEQFAKVKDWSLLDKDSEQKLTSSFLAAAKVKEIFASAESIAAAAKNAVGSLKALGNLREGNSPMSQLEVALKNLFEIAYNVAFGRFTDTDQGKAVDYSSFEKQMSPVKSGFEAANETLIAAIGVASKAKSIDKDALENSMKSIFKAADSAVSVIGKTDYNNFSTQAQSVSKGFVEVGAAMNAINSVSSVASTLGDSTTPGTKMNAVRTAMFDIFQVPADLMFHKFTDGNLNSVDYSAFSKQASSVKEGYDAFAQAVPAAKKAIDQAKTMPAFNTEELTSHLAKMTTAKNLFTQIDSVLREINTTVTSLSSLKISDTITKMVDSMDSINKSIGNIEVGKNGEIRVKLGEIAAGITKADETFNIKKAPVTINMEVHVELAVSNIEKAIMKANGAIKAAFNNLANLSSKGVSDSGALFEVGGK